MSDLQIFNCEQGSEEWLLCRLGVPSASCFDKVMAKGEGKTRRRYLRDLAGEIVTGAPAEGFTNGHMERGQAMEAEARERYELRQDVELERVGFLKRGRIGCSPDSLLGKDGLVEIKTKLPALQIELLESGELPSEHRAQVQGQLLVSGRDFVDFVSYWPGLPLFVKRVGRDEPFIARIKVEAAAFLDELDALVQRIRSMQ